MSTKLATAVSYTPPVARVDESNCVSAGNGAGAGAAAGVATAVDGVFALEAGAGFVAVVGVAAGVGLVFGLSTQGYLCDHDYNKVFFSDFYISNGNIVSEYFPLQDEFLRSDRIFLLLLDLSLEIRYFD